MLFEDLRQVALIGESTRHGDLSQRQRPLFKQKLRSLDSLAQEKLVRTGSRCLTEQTGKVIGAKAGLLSQCLKGEILVKMSLDEVGDSPHLLIRQPTYRFLDGSTFRSIMA